MRGTVLDVTAEHPSTSARDDDVREAYTAMDRDPCSVPPINAVVTAINALVDGCGRRPASCASSPSSATTTPSRWGASRTSTDVGQPGRVRARLAHRRCTRTACWRRGQRGLPLVRRALPAVRRPVRRARPRAPSSTPSSSSRTSPSAGWSRPRPQIRGLIEEFLAADGVRNLTGAYTASYDFLHRPRPELDALPRRSAAGAPTDQDDADNSDDWTQRPTPAGGQRQRARLHVGQRPLRQQPRPARRPERARHAGRSCCRPSDLATCSRLRADLPTAGTASSRPSAATPASTCRNLLLRPRTAGRRVRQGPGPDRRLGPAGQRRQGRLHRQHRLRLRRQRRDLLQREAAWPASPATSTGR